MVLVRVLPKAHARGSADSKANTYQRNTDNTQNTDKASEDSPQNKDNKETKENEEGVETTVIKDSTSTMTNFAVKGNKAMENAMMQAATKIR